MRRNTPEDVWKYIDKKSDLECWNWTLGIDDWGYGIFHINNKAYKSHRFVYELTWGEIPKDMKVCHLCDNTRCCNPKHLFVGTDADNMKDRNSKGRQVKGEKVHTHKLKSSQVKEIRKLFISGKYIQADLVKKYNMSSSTISRIITGKIWRGI